jgi:3-dehydroquinate dehydratase-1
MLSKIPEKAQPQIVGVIRSPADLQRALRMRKPPDFFEVRLDAFADKIDKLQTQLAKLAAPMIMTARHPAEGGAKQLSANERRDLLMQFLPLASYIDVELQSRHELRSVISEARTRRIGIVISLHDFLETPDASAMQKSRASASDADIFKIATLVKNSADIERLVRFVEGSKGKPLVAAMGMGKFGRKSRRLLAQAGSALNYASLSGTNELGQLSVDELRRIFARA